MCGLIGFMTNPKNYKSIAERGSKLRALMQQGLFVDSLRGMDATGIARVDGKGLLAPAFVYKRAMPAADFLQMKGAESMLEQMGEAAIMIGHNRSTTRGFSHKNSNAHPFQVDNITLAHNGTLTNYHSLSKRNPAEVDSAYITAAFADRPAIEVLPELEGAYALVWHDAADGTLNIAKNGQRPLAIMYFGEKDDKDSWEGFAFASEMGMLWWLMDRIGIPKANKFQLLPSETIIKFHPERYRQPTYLKYEVKPKETPRQHFTGGQGGTTTPLLPRPGTSSGAADSTTTPAAETPTGGSQAGDGTTTTKTVLSLPGGRKQQKGTKKLAALGLDYGTPLLCSPVSFSTHKKGTSGIAQFEYRPRGLTVEVQALSIADWNQSQRNGRATLACCTTRNGKGGKVIVMAEFVESRPRPAAVRVVPNAQHVHGPNGYKIPIAEFLNLTMDGCSVCGSPISAQFADSMLWIPGDEGKKPVCHECTANPMVRSMLEATPEKKEVTH